MNPSQKAGNVKVKRRRVRTTRRDAHVKRIARIEAKKVVSKKIESKVNDRNNDAFNITFNGSFFAMAGLMTQGVGQEQYIGDSIMPTHLRIRWTGEAGSTTNNMLRVIVLQDKAAGGTPTAATLLESAGTLITPISPFYLGYNETYNILYDEFFVLNAGTDSAKISGDIRIPGRKLRKISYQDAIGTVTTGGLWLCFFSDGLASPVYGQFYSRLYYKDA